TSLRLPHHLPFNSLPFTNPGPYKSHKNTTVQHPNGYTCLPIIYTSGSMAIARSMCTVLLISSWAKKTVSYRQIYPTVFSDKYAFHLSKHKVDNPHAADTAWPEDVLEQLSSDNFLEQQGFCSAQLSSHPKLYKGQLENGIRYLILPTKVPQNSSSMILAELAMEADLPNDVLSIVNVTNFSWYHPTQVSSINDNDMYT
ncbi:hypothetical protein M8C21_025911, partial [Ambrosia artemisiifolia]